MVVTSANIPRVWFITGCSSGLGRALAEYTLAAGDKVVATLRNVSALASLQNTYPETNLLVLPLDVSQPAQIESAFARAVKQFGRVDVVVNNAGYGLFCEIEGTPDEEARKVFEVQFWGPMNITKEATRIFRDVNPKGEGGLLINISSCGGYSAPQGLAFYASSKFALEGFTQSWTKEVLPEWNIRGLIIEPGGFETNWKSSSMVELSRHEAYTAPDTPTSKIEKIHKTASFMGVPERAAKAIWEVSKESRENLPLRLQLGSDSLALVTAAAKRTLQDAERWKAVSHSTNKDGVDVEKFMQEVAAATQ